MRSETFLVALVFVTASGCKKREGKPDAEACSEIAEKVRDLRSEDSAKNEFLSVCGAEDVPKYAEDYVWCADRSANAADLDVCDAAFAKWKNAKKDGCDALVTTVMKQLPEIQSAIEKLSDYESKPSVVYAFIEIVDAAIAKIEGLELLDDGVIELRREYGKVLTEARGMGTSLKASISDPKQRIEVIKTADRVVEMEDALVKRVNEYCALR